jgi:ABC-type proline/glycine betaine transport system substrate-binding protein
VPGKGGGFSLVDQLTSLRLCAVVIIIFAATAATAAAAADDDDDADNATVRLSQRGWSISPPWARTAVANGIPE